MIVVFVLVGIALFFVLYVWWSMKKKFGLSRAAAKNIEYHWVKMKKIQDPARRVMEADSILDQTLKELGYQGSLGEKLKKAGPILPNTNDVWNAHKLRNKIAHEPGVQVTDAEANRALRSFEKAIKKFL